MIKVRAYRNRVYTYITLEQYLKENCSEAPIGWWQDINELINRSLNITNDEDNEYFNKRMNLKQFPYERVKTLYINFKNSRYNNLLEDDILRYIAYIYGFGYFKRADFFINIHKPDLDIWLNTNNVLWAWGDKKDLPKDEQYSLMDLLSYKYGQNGIRRELLKSSKL